MDNFVNEGIIKLKFWDVTGDVISTQKRSETHISSSASTAYIQNGSGYINTPAINSSVSTNHEFWLKSDDGQEIPVRISGADIPLREEQKVTVIYAAKPNEEMGYPAIVVNHSANKHWLPYAADELNLLLGLSRPMRAHLLLIVVIYIASLFFVALTDLTKIFGIFTILWVPFIGPIAYIVYVDTKRKKLNTAISSHLENLAQTAYSS